MVSTGRTVHAPNGMVCSVDHLASAAGVEMMRRGGSAADAAVCASAVLAVTTQHMCGMGGDLFALVGRPGRPAALAAVGRAGSGADASGLRADGNLTMPMFGDLRSTTIPGCVDGWLALLERFGHLSLAEVLGPAIGYARDGFPASPLLVGAVGAVAHLPGADDYRGDVSVGTRLRRPLVARTLESIVDGGRDAFYGGAFGRGLIELGSGLYSEEDLAAGNAEWVEPLSVPAWGHEIWTVPPPSQGYLALASAWIADGLDLPDDPNDPQWAHLLAESSRVAGLDRIQVLHEGAAGDDLLAADRLRAQRAAVDPARAGRSGPLTRPGGTIHLATADASGMGVSLIQSNAAGWGARFVVPGTGVFLQNRGIGFSLEIGHPAELAPGRRPPHTLAPALVTANGEPRVVLGTMGGDIQPQVVLQLLARILVAGQSPGAAVRAPRWHLGSGGFDTWRGDGPNEITVESDAPESWAPGLTALGHHVDRASRGANFGHAHAIVLAENGMLSGGSDPRALTGAATGF